MMKYDIVIAFQILSLQQGSSLQQVHGSNYVSKQCAASLCIQLCTFSRTHSIVYAPVSLFLHLEIDLCARRKIFHQNRNPTAEIWEKYEFRLQIHKFFNEMKHSFVTIFMRLFLGVIARDRQSQHSGILEMLIVNSQATMTV